MRTEISFGIILCLRCNIKIISEIKFKIDNLVINIASSHNDIIFIGIFYIIMDIPILRPHIANDGRRLNNIN